jgi:hypothetical protein
MLGRQLCIYVGMWIFVQEYRLMFVPRYVCLRVAYHVYHTIVPRYVWLVVGLTLCGVALDEVEFCNVTRITMC